MVKCIILYNLNEQLKQGLHFNGGTTASRLSGALFFYNLNEQLKQGLHFHGGTTAIRLSGALFFIILMNN